MASRWSSRESALFLFLFLALGALGSGPAAACSCMRPDKGPEQQLAEGAIVALGAPTLITGEPAERGVRYAPVRYRFEVHKALGASIGAVITVETADNSAQCGVRLKEREIVMLRLMPGEGGAFHVNLCSQLFVESYQDEWRALFDAQK